MKYVSLQSYPVAHSFDQVSSQSPLDTTGIYSAFDVESDGRTIEISE